MKIIQITVSSDGQTKLETKGFVGSECQQASRFVEQALGNCLNEQRTSEYYPPAQVEVKAAERTSSS
ncbi:MAG: DUF2997 domain-containing protein [Planctomycetota bacterium]